MSTTLKLTKANFIMFLRNRQAVFFTFFSPLMIMVIFGLIGFDSVPKFDVGIVSLNPNTETRELVERLKSFPTFEAHEGTIGDEIKELQEGNRVVVLEIPHDLLQSDSTPSRSIMAYVNESKQAEAQTVLSILNQFVDKTLLTRAQIPPYITVQQSTINSRDLKYLDFLLPGLVAMSVMQMSVFSVAFVFAQYKEKGVLKRLLATPMKPFQFVLANTITRLVVSVIQAAIFIAVGILLLDATVIGSYPLILIVIVLGALMFLGLGFTISGLVKTVEAVPALANLIVFPMLFLGGTFFPIESFPDWLQKIAKFLLLTYFSTALRDVMTKDAGLGDIKWDLVAMTAWSLGLIILATLTFRFQEKDSA